MSNVAVVPAGGEFAVTDLDSGEVLSRHIDAETATAAALASPYRCPTCKRTVTVTADRKLPIHTLAPGKPARGACPSSLLAVSFVSGDRVR